MKLLLFALTSVLLLTLANALLGRLSSPTVNIRPLGDFNSTGAVLKMYKINNGNYPTQEEGLKALVEKPINFHPDKRWTQLADAIPLDPWGNPYQYIAPSTTDGEFGLYSLGRDGISQTQGNDPDDINNWSPYKSKKSWTDRFKDKNVPLMTAYALLLFAIVRWIRIQFLRRKSNIS